MVYRQFSLLIAIVALTIITGCVTPYKAGSIPEVNAIKLRMNQQEAIAIITNNVLLWWGYKNEIDKKRRESFEKCVTSGHPQLKYSAKLFRVTPTGVSFIIRGQSNCSSIVRHIEEGEKFEFAEVKEIHPISYFKTDIYLFGDESKSWLMRATIDGDKKLYEVLAALEILCPNLLK